MKVIRFMFLLLLLPVYNAQGQQDIVTGMIISEKDKTPISGATVRLKGESIGISTDNIGVFNLMLTGSRRFSLLISAIGYKSREYEVAEIPAIPLVISLKESVQQIEEVFVSTGYQEIGKERATGSFVYIDNELMNRRVSPNILDRLEDIASGLVFNRAGSTQDPISIRGRSTLYANASPLIVIDNFPYDGDLSNINPNDVEDITILKDAAAASIWGARAGNGVIVIKTKTGRFNQTPKLSFNSSFGIGERPDLFYHSKMSIEDHIQTEIDLFGQGYYKSSETSTSFAPLSPVVELLIAKRDGLIDKTYFDSQLEVLKKQDVRNDFTDYFYQPSVNQQYSLNLNGGSTIQQYYISAGYDKNLESLVGNQFNRFTINARNTYSLIHERLKVTNSLSYSESNRSKNNPGHGAINMSSSFALPPYTQLADQYGSHSITIKDYRQSYAENAENVGLLNWKYSPLDELALADNKQKEIDFRINTSIGFELIDGLNAGIFYQYGRSFTNNKNLYQEQTYFVRDLINQYTQVGEDGKLNRAIPIGGILDLGNRTAISHNLRGQLSYDKQWNDHSLNAIGGWELRDHHIIGDDYRLYGYDAQHAVSSLVDYSGTYKLYPTSGTRRVIPNADRQSDLTDRFISYYTNAAYSFKGIYTVSASARLDQSNLFGVDANQRGVPLWSTGLSWNIANENFYSSDWMQQLKLRVTYGYSGNIDKSITALTTARMMGFSHYTGLPYARIINPPNPQLRWERIRMLNFGLDFSAFGHRLKGNVDYYRKWGLDLIGDAPIALSSGIEMFRGNTASTKGQGIDLVLNTVNIDKAFKWESNILLSHVKDVVTNYSVPPLSIQIQLNSSNGVVMPIKGKPIYTIYSLPWHGLDPNTGAPLIYLDGKLSQDYRTFLNSQTPESLIYNGPVRPVTFGAFRNTFSYRGWSLSANFSYRMGHFFRRESIRYGSTRGLGSHGDYAFRWQKPGDERWTVVPSIPQKTDANRENVYSYSEILVEKGDHIRFQDVNLNYLVPAEKIKNLPIKSLQVYMYANNLGLIWKATKSNLDPDFLTMRPIRTVSLGLRIDL